MGQVFRARDLHSGRQVALKVIRSRLTPQSLERFRREGELTARLDHPGIVRVHSAGVCEEQPFLVYELVEGGQTLAGEIETVERAAGVALLEQVAEALGFAHALGVIHRDVKPANLLIDSTGRARLADFGLARATDLQPITHTGALVGTPYYMAPELFTGSSAPGPQVDVWSLGVVLYRVLTRRLPFEGANAVELMESALKVAPPAPRALDPSIPVALEAVCLKCLAVRPQDRYPDAAALLRDLRAARGGEQVSALRSRWRGLGVVVGAFALTALGVAVALTVGRGRPPADPPAHSGAVADAHAAERLLEDARLELAVAEWIEQAWELPAGVNAAPWRQRAARAFEAALEAAPEGSSVAVRAREGLQQVARAGNVVAPADLVARRAEASAFWERSTRELEQASVPRQLELCAEVLRLDPSHLPAASLHARLQFFADEPEQALDACLAVARRAPRELDSLWRGLQQAKASHAVVPGSGPWARLSAMADEPPASEAPDRVLLEALLVECSAPDLGRERRALKRLDALLAAELAHPPAWILRGFLHLRCGEFERAEADLELARELAPTSALLAFYRALLRARRREPSAAVLAELVHASFLGHPVWEAGWDERFPELRRYEEELASIAQAEFFQRGPERRSPYGRLEEIRADGTVLGWAVDPDTPARAVEIHVFVDGVPNDETPRLALLFADEDRPSVAAATRSPGGHGLRLQLPASLRDGRTHELYVFAVDTEKAADNPQLIGSGLRFRLAAN